MLNYNGMNEKNLKRTSKLIRGDEDMENQNGTSSPSDGASCSKSLMDLGVARCEFIADLGESFMNTVHNLKSKYPNRNIKGDVVYKYDQDHTVKFSIT
jgi:hypothetical protein